MLQLHIDALLEFISPIKFDVAEHDFGRETLEIWWLTLERSYGLQWNQEQFEPGIAFQSCIQMIMDPI